MDQKKIDRIFQEQLKNLEATPNKRVWNGIESKLQKKKRRVIPFWWFSSGIAAILIFSFFLFPIAEKNTNINNNIINTVVTTTKSKSKNKKTTDSFLEDKQEKIIVAKTRKETTNKKRTIKKKELVNTKKAMKKTFLATTSSNKKTEKIKKEPTTNTKNNFKEANKKSDISKKENTTKKINLTNFLSKKDSTFKPKPLKEKWAIAPLIGILNSNSFKNTTSNTISGQNSLSYGLQIEYKIAKKWTVRSGIYEQKIGFSNNQFTAIASVNGLQSIELNEEHSLRNSEEREAIFDEAIEQFFGYIEIPLEIKYNLFNTKKFNTQIVAGFSSLFLNENKITTQNSLELGTANNLNNINFSGNFGFDFNYSFTKNILLNLNPMFKTQLNTFSDTNNFTPFYIGIYTGLKYNF